MVKFYKYFYNDNYTTNNALSHNYFYTDNFTSNKVKFYNHTDYSYLSHDYFYKNQYIQQEQRYILQLLLQRQLQKQQNLILHFTKYNYTDYSYFSNNNFYKINNYTSNKVLSYKYFYDDNSTATMLYSLNTSTTITTPATTFYLNYSPTTTTSAARFNLQQLL